jgi:ATP dependent DNA ligase domain
LTRLADTPDMRIKRIPDGFIVPAQPVLASRPPSGPDWVHEIKHDRYRMIVHRDGPTVRLYSRNAYEWTARLPAIAAAAPRIEAKRYTIDGEAVVLGPDGLSRFEELRSREAARAAIHYAFDLIEHDGEDMRNRPFLDRKNALARLLRNTEGGILFMNTSPSTALSSSRTLAGLGPRASFPSESTARIDPALVRSGSRSAIPPASPRNGSGARCGIGDPRTCSAESSRKPNLAQKSYPRPTIR